MTRRRREKKSCCIGVSADRHASITLLGPEIAARGAEIEHYKLTRIAMTR